MMDAVYSQHVPHQPLSRSPLKGLSLHRGLQTMLFSGFLSCFDFGYLAITCSFFGLPRKNFAFFGLPRNTDGMHCIDNQREICLSAQIMHIQCLLIEKDLKLSKFPTCYPLWKRFLCLTMGSPGLIINSGILEFFMDHTLRSEHENLNHDESEGHFQKTSSKKLVVVPCGVIAIQDRAFQTCSMSRVVLPYGLKSIGSFVFHGCTLLQTIDMKMAPCSRIGNGAFAMCSSLQSLTLPKILDEIADHLFFKCKNLKSVVFPLKLKAIGDAAFMHCTSLTSLCTADNYNYDDRNLATLPMGLKRIGRKAFQHCASLSQIRFPDTLTSIGECAFKGCEQLDSIHIPPGVLHIPVEMCRGCSNLTQLTFSSALFGIGDRAFCDCHNLEVPTLPQNTAIGQGAFFGAQVVPYCILA